MNQHYVRNAARRERRIPCAISACASDAGSRVGAGSRGTPSGARGVRWPFLLVLAALLPVATFAAPELGFDTDSAGTGSLFLRMPSGYGAATRIDSEVELDVSGLVVRATLRQVFRNEGDEWVEGLYVFPLPESAAVHRLRLAVGERVIEGEVREKAEAEGAFEAAKQAGQQAGLVRQQRANLFTTRLANIAPGETVTVEIGYLDTARYDEGTFSLRIPMTLTPRYTPATPKAGPPADGESTDAGVRVSVPAMMPPAVSDSRGHRVSLAARIDAGMPLEFVGSRYHPVSVEQRSGRYHVGFALDGVPMDHDIELFWRPVPEAQPRAMLFSEEVGGQPHLLLMLMPPGAAQNEIEAPPREVVFVIDTSGSMHGGSLEQAQQSLRFALDGLRPGDLFNVIRFSSETEALYRASEPASPVNLDQAREFVDSLQADGGTEMRPALERALDGMASPGYLRQVIFITDGSVGNEAELFTLIEDRLGDARLFTVGIGPAPNGWFMRKAAEAGRGAFVTVSVPHEAEEQMRRLFRKLEQPRVTDIGIDWPKGLQPEMHPAAVPDLYAGEPVMVRARLARSPVPGEELVVRGRSGRSGWRASLPLAGRESGGVAATWARAHIAALVDRERRGESPELTRPAIVSTALTHRLVSKYTSLVAVDRTPVRPAAAPLTSERVPNLMPFGLDTAAVIGFPATATMAPVYRRNGAILLGIGALLLFWQVWTVRGRGRDED